MHGRAPAALRTQAHPAAHPARQATAATGPETLAMSRSELRQCMDVRLRLCGRRRTRQRTGKAGDCGHGARDAGDEPPGAA